MVVDDQSCVICLLLPSRTFQQRYCFIGMGLICVAGGLIVWAAVAVASITETSGEYSLTDIVIQPEVLNKRGYVGKGMLCPKKEVAVGFRMKIQKEVRDTFQVQKQDHTQNEAVFHLT